MMDSVPRLPGSALPKNLIDTVQKGALAYRYKGIPTWKDPFDLAIYSMLLWQLKPASIIEIGSNQGGSALWLHDVMTNYGVACEIHSVDIRPPTLCVPGITFHQGDARNLGAILDASLLRRLQRPLFVIEDSDHQARTTLAVLNFFDPWLQRGEFIVVEDGIITDMGDAGLYGGGPSAAISAFLSGKPGRYAVDRECCDWFGQNVTWNVNGYLRRL
jgi:cephalosporin hydroxylase